MQITPGTPAEKRLELEEHLTAYHCQLAADQGADFVHAGKCLLLGRYYAESPFVYFSLNPGFARDGSPLDLGSDENLNVPFLNSDKLRSQYVYLHNCQRFLTNHPDLGEWMNSRVTSAFLVPWRTKNASDLYAVNRRSGGRLFEFSRELVRLIIRHHEARLLITAGKSAINLLNDLAVPDQAIYVERFCGPGGSYQWSRSEAKVEGTSLTILQIPHFSRANSPVKLGAFGQWLRGELQSFHTAAPRNARREPRGF